jgi:hypothetical protein
MPYLDAVPRPDHNYRHRHHGDQNNQPHGEPFRGPRRTRTSDLFVISEAL